MSGWIAVAAVALVMVAGCSSAKNAASSVTHAASAAASIKSKASGVASSAAKAKASASGVKASASAAAKGVSAKGVQTGVHAGSFCTPAGATGRTDTGQTVHCDHKQGQSQARWYT